MVPLHSHFHFSGSQIIPLQIRIFGTRKSHNSWSGPHLSTAALTDKASFISVYGVGTVLELFLPTITLANRISRKFIFSRCITKLAAKGIHYDSLSREIRYRIGDVLVHYYSYCGALRGSHWRKLISMYFFSFWSVLPFVVTQWKNVYVSRIGCSVRKKCWFPLVYFNKRIASYFYGDCIREIYLWKLYVLYYRLDLFSFWNDYTNFDCAVISENS